MAYVLFPSTPSHLISLSRKHVLMTVNFILITVRWPFNSLALVFYQEQVAKRVRSSIHRLAEPNGHLFLRRPFQIGWFVSQVSTYVFPQPSSPLHTSSSVPISIEFSEASLYITPSVKPRSPRVLEVAAVLYLSLTSCVLLPVSVVLSCLCCLAV